MLEQPSSQVPQTSLQWASGGHSQRSRLDLGPHGTKASKLQYDRPLAEWLQNSRNPLCGLDDGITIVELCARHYKFAKQYYQWGGNCTGETPNIRIALRFLREWYAKTPAVEFGPLTLKTLRQLGRRFVTPSHRKVSPWP